MRGQEFAPALLVIAYGNPLRGDDAFGWHVARALLERAPDGVEVVTSHQLGPELAEAVAQARAVVFVDASAEALPGELRLRRLDASPLPRSFTHHLHPGHLLALAGALYGRAAPARLLTVGAASLDLGEALTPQVARQVPAAVDEVWRLSRPWPDPEGPALPGPEP